MIPTNEEIQNLQHGDIITVYFNPKTLCYLETNKSDESFLPVKMHYIGCDRFVIAAAITKNILDDQSFDFIYDNFGDSFCSITKKLEELSSSERVEFDSKHCCYIDNDWIFEIEKRQLKNSDPCGMNCCECNEFYRYAVSNLSNGNLACWNCRDSYKWKYSELYIGGK